MSGYIPKTVIYLSYLNSEDERQVDVAPGDKPGRLDTAKKHIKWQMKKDSSLEEEEVENDPINVLQLREHIFYTSGHKHYSMVDFGERSGWVSHPTLIESIVKSGASNEGFILGPFIWCVYDNDMQLMREDSEEVQALREEKEEKKKVKPLRPKGVAVGDIFGDDDGYYQKIFLGKHKLDGDDVYITAKLHIRDIKWNRQTNTREVEKEYAPEEAYEAIKTREKHGWRNGQSVKTIEKGVAEYTKTFPRLFKKIAHADVFDLDWIGQISHSRAYGYLGAHHLEFDKEQFAKKE